jgi:hypothetical protein
LLFGTGSRASAAGLSDTALAKGGTIAGGFAVNGRHLSFGATRVRPCGPAGS